MRALSVKALASQEHILQDCAHSFIEGIRKELLGGPGVIDIAKWFSIATFDVIGDLAFGKLFGGFESGKLHPWVTIVFGASKAPPYLRVLREVPGVLLIGNYARHLLPANIKQQWLDHFNYVSDLLEKRFKNPKERPDFIYYLIDRSGTALTRNEIKENAAQMVTAGSEPVWAPLSFGDFALR
jgi:cytochrome P450